MTLNKLKLGKFFVVVALSLFPITTVLAATPALPTTGSPSASTVAKSNDSNVSTEANTIQDSGNLVSPAVKDNIFSEVKSFYKNQSFRFYLFLVPESDTTFEKSIEQIVASYKYEATQNPIIMVYKPATKEYRFVIDTMLQHKVNSAFIQYLVDNHFTPLIEAGSYDEAVSTFVPRLCANIVLSSRAANSISQKEISPEGFKVKSELFVYKSFEPSRTDSSSQQKNATPVQKGNTTKQNTSPLIYIFALFSFIFGICGFIYYKKQKEKKQNEQD